MTWEVVRDCPFQDCDWTYDRPTTIEHSDLDADMRVEEHYDREHTGEVKLRAVFTKRVTTTTHNDAQQYSDELHDRLLVERPAGMELAFTAGEVLEEADDHSEVDDD